MSNELEQLRRFRIEHTRVDAASLQRLKSALHEHISSSNLERGQRRSGAHSPRRRRGLAIEVIRRFATRGPSLATALLPVLVSVAAIAFALTIGADHHAQSPGAPKSNARTSRSELISLLGVLRSPQTAPARAFNHKGWLYPGIYPGDQPGSRVEPDRSLIRLATVTPWGAKVFIVPLTSPKDPGLARTIGETAALWVQGMGWSDYIRVQDLKAGPSSGPGATIRLPDGHKIQRFLMLVPDGIARIKIELLGAFPLAGKPVIFEGSITAQVHSNVAAFQTTGAGSASVAFAIWYGAGGRIIGRGSAWSGVRRVGDRYIEKPAHPGELAAEAKRLARLSRLIRGWCARHRSSARLPKSLSGTEGPDTRIVCRRGRPALRRVL